MTHNTEAARLREKPAFYTADASDPVLQDKFWSRVDKRGPTECWNWQGVISYQGYGSFSTGRRPMPAHRFAYLMVNDLEDHSLVIDHICRNRRCVNPAHLRAISLTENVMSGLGITANNARKTHCLRGHELAGDNLLVRRQGWRMCRACCRISKQKQREARLARAATLDREGKA